MTAYTAFDSLDSFCQLMAAFESYPVWAAHKNFAVLVLSPNQMLGRGQVQIQVPIESQP